MFWTKEKVAVNAKKYSTLSLLNIIQRMIIILLKQIIGWI